MTESGAVDRKKNSSSLLRLRLSFGRQSIMLYNAAALSGGAGVTAALGFGYWWYAARMFPAEAVGFAAAAISLMNFLALVSELGLGTLLIGELRKAGVQARSLVSATLFLTSASAVISGIAYLAFSGLLSIDLGTITSAPAYRVVFVAGLAVTGFVLVLDQAFVAMLRSTLQMSRTTAFAASKLLILYLVGVFGLVGEFHIFASWIGGQLCSIVLLWVICIYRGEPVWYRPRLSVLRPLWGIVLKHHLLSIVIQAPGLMLPVVVAVVLSPRTNAAFYAAWTLVNVVLLVPASLTSVLYSVASRGHDVLRHHLKMSLSLSAVVTVTAGVALMFSSEFILRLFNPVYPEIAGPSLGILGFGAIGVMLKYHYVVVQRIRYRMLSASLVLAAFGAAELVAATIGARNAGLFGLTKGWLAVTLLEAVALSPVVLRALRADVVAAVPVAGPIAHPAVLTTSLAGATRNRKEVQCAT